MAGPAALTQKAPDTLPGDFFDKQQVQGKAPDTLPGDFFDKQRPSKTPAPAHDQTLTDPLSNADAAPTQTLRKLPKFKDWQYHDRFADPVATDCSSFVQAIAKQQGHDIPRTAIEQYNKLPKVLGPATGGYDPTTGKQAANLGPKTADISKLQPGDVVFFDNLARTPENTNGKRAGDGYVNHVAYYIGNGQVIQDNGHGVLRKAPLGWMTTAYRFMGAARPGMKPAELTPDQTNRAIQGSGHKAYGPYEMIGDAAAGKPLTPDQIDQVAGTLGMAPLKGSVSRDVYESYVRTAAKDAAKDLAAARAKWEISPEANARRPAQFESEAARTALDLGEAGQGLRNISTAVLGQDVFSGTGIDTAADFAQRQAGEALDDPASAVAQIGAFEGGGKLLGAFAKRVAPYVEKGIASLRGTDLTNLTNEVRIQLESGRSAAELKKVLGPDSYKVITQAQRTVSRDVSSGLIEQLAKRRQARLKLVDDPNYPKTEPVDIKKGLDSAYDQAEGAYVLSKWRKATKQAIFDVTQEIESAGSSRLQRQTAAQLRKYRTELANSLDDTLPHQTIEDQLRNDFRGSEQSAHLRELAPKPVTEVRGAAPKPPEPVKAPETPAAPAEAPKQPMPRFQWNEKTNLFEDHPQPAEPRPEPTTKPSGPGAVRASKAKPPTADLPEGALQTPKREDIAAVREQMGWDEYTSGKRTWEEAAQEAYSKGYIARATQIAQKVLKAPRALSDSETAGLGMALKGHLDQMEKLKALGDGPNWDLHHDAANEIANALDRSGTEKGRSLAAQKMVLSNSYDQFSVERRILKVRPDATPEQIAQIEKTRGELETLEKQRAQSQARQSRQSATAAFEKATGRYEANPGGSADYSGDARPPEMSDALYDLHQRPVRVNGIVHPSSRPAAVNRFLQDTLRLASSRGDERAVQWAKSALDNFDKGDLPRAAADAEGALGKMHEVERAAFAAKSKRWLVSEETYAQAKKDILVGGSGGGTNILGPLDPVRVAALAKMAGYHLENAITTGGKAINDVFEALKKDAPGFEDSHYWQAMDAAMSDRSRTLNAGRAFGEDILTEGKSAIQSADVAKLRTELDGLRKEFGRAKNAKDAGHLTKLKNQIDQLEGMSKKPMDLGAYKSLRESMMKTSRELNAGRGMGKNVLRQGMAGIEAPEVAAARERVDQLKLKIDAQIKDLSMPLAAKVFNSVENFPRAITIGGGIHGPALMFTHAVKNLFRPSTSLMWLENTVKAWRVWAGDDAIYNEAMQRLTGDPLPGALNHETKVQLGLAVDRHYVEDFTLASRIIQKVGGPIGKGARAADFLKVLRNQMYDHFWLNASPETRAAEGFDKRLASWVNEATGAHSLGHGWGATLVDHASFAARLEASNWAATAIGPFKMIGEIASKDPASRAMGLMRLKQGGQLVATYEALLGMNWAINKFRGVPDRKNVNFFDFHRGDFQSFSDGATTWSPMSRQTGILRLIENTLEATYKQATGTLKPNEPTATQEILQYGRGKFNPIYSIAADAIMRRDFMNRPMPWASEKEKEAAKAKGKEPYSWDEYLADHGPIPVSDGAKAFYDGMRKGGIDAKTAEAATVQLFLGLIGTRTGKVSTPPKDAIGRAWSPELDKTWDSDPILKEWDRLRGPYVYRVKQRADENKADFTMRQRRVEQVRQSRAEAIYAQLKIEMADPGWKTMTDDEKRAVLHSVASDSSLPGGPNE